MKPISYRRIRRRTASHEGGVVKKDTQQEQTFFGDSTHETFFQPAPVIQRKCAECDKEEKAHREPEKKEEEKKLQRAEDKKEEEKVMKKEDKKEEEKIMKAEDNKEEEKIQKSDAGASSVSANNVSSYISSLSGKGQPLPASTNYFFSSKMGYDFSNVKVHTDKEAVQSAKEINAKAYTTGNNIVFNQGRYNITSAEGKKLMAHELTHVMQQGAVNRMIQRDVAIEPVASDAAINLGRSEIVGALAHNRRFLTDANIISELRDVLGISRNPAVVDEAFVRAVARWQAANGITQDGRIGRITVVYLAEEMEAEGLTVIAEQFRNLFPRSHVLNVDNRFCGCEPDLTRAIADNLFFINEYQTCGNNRSNRTGAQIEACIVRSLRSQGLGVSVGGSTSSTGNIQVTALPGACGPLLTSDTFIHEWSHDNHRRELVRRFGTGAAFSNAWDSASDWVSDEIRSRVVENNYLNWLISRLTGNCP